MSYFLLLVRDGIPGVLKKVGETWDESVEVATEILNNQTLCKDCPALKEDDIEECFTYGAFATTDPFVDIYFICDE